MKRKHADCALAPLVISPRRKSQRAAPLLGAPGGKVPEDPPRKPASTPSADAAAPPPCAVLPGAGAEQQQQQEMHGGAADMAFAYHTTRNGASAAAGERMCPAVPHGQSWMLWVLVRGGGWWRIVAACHCVCLHAMSPRRRLLRLWPHGLIPRAGLRWETPEPLRIDERTRSHPATPRALMRLRTAELPRDVMGMTFHTTRHGWGGTCAMMAGVKP